MRAHIGLLVQAPGGLEGEEAPTGISPASRPQGLYNGRLVAGPREAVA